MTFQQVLRPPIALALLLHVGAAHDALTWIGKIVVTKYQCPLTVDNRVIQDGRQFRIYTVTRARGDSLWVVSESIEGWLPVSRVVPFDEATDFYAQEIKRNSSNADAYNYRGLLWHVKQKYDAAIADYSEAIRCDSTSTQAYTYRGRAWCDKKEYDKAVADCNEAIRLDPKNCAALFTTGALRGDTRESSRSARRLRRGDTLGLEILPDILRSRSRS